MKRSVCLMALMLWWCADAAAVEDSHQRAVRLFKQHHYEDAANFLYGELKGNDSDATAPAYLSLGMICLENAKLYNELYRVGLAVNLDYLTRLIADEDRYQSSLANLYLGQTLLQTGEIGQSVGFFNKFAGDRRVSPDDRQMAEIGLGAAYFMQGKPERAERHWSKLKSVKPDVTTALADTYSRLGLTAKQPVAMCEAALGQISTNGQKMTMITVNGALGVFARAGRVDDSFGLLERADLRGFFHEETPSRNKQIRFYDPTLMANLSQTYSRAAIQFLEMAAASSSAKINWAAQYYLCESQDLFGNPEQTLQMAEAVLSRGDIPEAVKSRIKVRVAAVKHSAGQDAAAVDLLKDVLEAKSDPNLIADVLLVCCRHGWDYAPAVIQAVETSQKGSGASYAGLNYALGKYHLWKKDYLKAITYMEAGRDKSNKNRIEFNDPIMLVNLADAYYYTRKFSEALEIYFEMSKQFPAIRQIQVALQGVYSMEQQSAGDAKIF